MVCKRCGAELKETDKFCGVCGEPVGEEKKPTPIVENSTPQPAKHDENETACLICGIVSFFTCWIGIVLAIISIVLGSKIKKNTGKMPAGMICGIISLSINVLIILLYIFIYVFAFILGVD